MACIELNRLAHKYQAADTQPDYALHPFTHVWEDGQIYALLGPSGCGKTTLLNIMSGLVRPSEGRVMFDGRDVTDMPTAQRNIAQVFQFPVIYRTMTVFENLAFPLRCRRLPENEIRKRVNEVADLLNLGPQLQKPALNLTVDAKQLISLGRGLVRRDVAAILFDEPLTVIDPQLKFELRRKIKEANRHYGITMIYVTHDQAEAMTLASRVVVMNHGKVVQVGTPQELFEQPQDAFVGYFIGSPAMNMLDCKPSADGILIGGQQLRLTAREQPAMPAGTRFSFGVRPEYVTLSSSAGPERLAARLVDIKSAGAFRIVSLDLNGQQLRAKVRTGIPIPTGEAFVGFMKGRRLLYADGRLVTCS